VWWVNDKAQHELRARWSFHHTREAAQRAAPTTGEVFSIVNVARRPWVHVPNVDELVKRSRLQPSWPEHGPPKSRFTGI
jgi:hypothetical protein